MIDIKRDILPYAICAPSGDNSQPWHFVIKDGMLVIKNIPGRDNPYLNFEQSGSLLSHGAVIENVVIAAAECGYKAHVDILPEGIQSVVTARIRFEETEVARDSLFRAIVTRATNRRPYKTTPLSDDVVRELHTAASQCGARLELRSSPAERRALGKAGSDAEIMILENDELHSLLFGNVVWSEEEELRTRAGLYIKTMEFNPIQRLVFGLAADKRLMRIFRKLGLPRFVAFQDATLYATGAALGAIILEKTGAADFIAAGRALQRVWLTATAHELAMQPVTTTLFIGRRIKSGQADALDPAHVKLMTESYSVIERTFDAEGKNIAAMFRIGFAKSPSARSSRKEPVIEDAIV